MVVVVVTFVADYAERMLKLRGVLSMLLLLLLLLFWVDFIGGSFLGVERFLGRLFEFPALQY